MVNESDSAYIHIDIMDGSFVPNISFGFPVTQAIHTHAKKPLDFHLMIDRPEQYLKQCVESGAEIISVHYEACNHLHRTIQEIQNLGVKAGVALNPHTSMALIDDIIEDVDLVLLMSVNPGFGGQKFIENTVRKVESVVKLAEGRNSNLEIEIDGGVDMTNAKRLRDAGATMLVAGSSVFKTSDPKKAIKSLKHS